MPENELKLLMTYVHRGEISFPLRRSQLLLLKTPLLAEHGNVLLGLDEAGVRAVIVAVLAERRGKSA